MHMVHDLANFLETFAPSSLAAEWDNVGLLVGDRACRVDRVMTCLTITLESASEAIEACADLIVTHHPFPFKPLKRMTGDTREGRILLDLISAGISIYSPHTAFDSAQAGINQQLAEGLQLQQIQPLVPQPDSLLGMGRHGLLPEPLTLDELAQRVKDWLQLPGLKRVGRASAVVRRVAVACGSAGEFWQAAHLAQCDAFLTGETSFHTCLAAQSHALGMLLVGHYASERFAVEQLASVLAAEFPSLHIWASQREQDPLQWL